MFICAGPPPPPPPRMFSYFDVTTGSIDIARYMWDKRKHRRTYGKPQAPKSTGNFRPRRSHRRRDPKRSQWYIDYVVDESHTFRDDKHRNGKLFRRRFRVPFEFYKQLVEKVKKDW